MRIIEVIEKVKENATAGATSSGNIATVTSPHIAIGKDRTNVSYQEHQNVLVQKHLECQKLYNQKTQTVLPKVLIKCKALVCLVVQELDDESK